MFIPLHQRLQLERMGHDTSFEREVHDRMTAKGGKTFEQQKRDRDRAAESEVAGIQSKAASSWMDAARRVSRENVLEDITANGGLVDEAALAAVAESAEFEEESTDGDAPRRSLLRAKIVDIEAKRILVNLPGAGLRYFDFDHVLNDAPQVCLWSYGPRFQ